MRGIAALVIAGSLIASVTLSAAVPARAETDAEIEQIVRRQVQPMLIAAGGMAVALNIDGRTLLFNYGLADVARKTPITSDSLFNLASEFVAETGLVAVFLLMVAESACIPIPSEATMLFAGFAVTNPGAAAAHHHLTLLGIVAAGVVGNLVGSWIAYGVGRFGRL